MAKPKTKASPSQPAKSAARRASNRSAPQRAEKRSANRAPNPRGLAVRPETKQEKILSMLRSTGGVSIAAAMSATGWQKHSVRGFLASVVRKRLKLDLVSEDSQGTHLSREGKATSHW